MLCKPCRYFILSLFAFVYDLIRQSNASNASDITWHHMDERLLWIRFIAFSHKEIARFNKPFKRSHSIFSCWPSVASSHYPAPFQCQDECETRPLRLDCVSLQFVSQSYSWDSFEHCVEVKTSDEYHWWSESWFLPSWTSHSLTIFYLSELLFFHEMKIRCDL